MSILGNRVLRSEDPKFLTVGGSYIADLELPNAACVTFVRAQYAHARVESVDVSEARRAPGVIGAFTAADIDLDDIPPTIPFINAAMPRPVRAQGVVRFVGDMVAAVVTETRAQGEDAAELVEVEYEPLPVLVDLEQAASSQVLLFPEAATNVVAEFPSTADEGFFDGCEVVVSQRIVNQRVAPCPLEPRGAASLWGSDGRLTHWACTQAPHGVRDGLAERLGLSPSDVRVIAPDVGGGFGAKTGVYPEELLVAWLARKLDRPMTWIEPRTESMLVLGHVRAQIQDEAIGGSPDGRVTAYKLHILQDAGAYPAIGSILPFITNTMAPGTYRIERVDFASTSVVTNTTPTVAYRGAGRPEATAALERIMDCFAAEIGMDPAEVRRRNFVPADAFPYVTAVGTTYDTGAYEKGLDL